MTTLMLARNHLHDAINNLTAPLYHDGHPLPSRYDQLRDAITTKSVTGHGHTRPASMIPAQIDALLLTIKIDRRTRQLTTNITGDTPTRLAALAAQKFRPQDIEVMEAMTADIAAYTKAIDDLFAPKPLYLPNTCPQCQHDHAYRWADDGQRIRTPALALTLEGAWCQNCHAAWNKGQLGLLSRLLGFTPTAWGRLGGHSGIF